MNQQAPQNQPQQPNRPIVRLDIPAELLPALISALALVDALGRVPMVQGAQLYGLLQQWMMQANNQSQGDGGLPPPL